MDHVENKRWGWQQALDSRTEYLVDLADQTISEARMKELTRSLKVNQLSNMLSVTQATDDGVAAVVNWVRYQMGRRETSRAWKQTGLGDQVLKSIREMAPEAHALAEKIYGQPTEAQIRQIHLAMIRQYVGYMRRWFVARGGQ